MQIILVSTKTYLQNLMSNNSIGIVMILSPIGYDSIRMSLIPKLGDGINCVFLIDKRDKLAPMSPLNINKTTISSLQLHQIWSLQDKGLQHKSVTSKAL